LVLPIYIFLYRNYSAQDCLRRPGGGTWKPGNLVANASGLRSSGRSHSPTGFAREQRLRWLNHLRATRRALRVLRGSIRKTSHECRQNPL